MLNRITQQIQSSKNIFKQIKRLPKINYKDFLIIYEESWFNQDIIDTYNKWNRQYGMNINIDEDDTDKNNIWKISSLLREEFVKIEPDENKVLYSLVYDLYGKSSSRAKNLLWYVYGEELYNNLIYNVGKRKICKQCGNVEPEWLYEGKCDLCYKDAKEKVISCIDCGKTMIIPTSKKRIIRCRACQDRKNQDQKNEYLRKRKRDKGLRTI